ncbi:hypothetical protein [Glycomyces buryatensis]|uniref:Uncharacterized protein n=1 Tax=Glycomyces buryatensis TaxID=2570927 RepID=A0A4S8Q8R0_9ACTN|nr:hypothetical protein [Glycomyces buryatensis]THV40570.1 hypothetical protein FAB82_14990 [Glycomyces buryatensis]
MIELIVIAAITTVFTHAVGMRVTDSIHAVKGTETARMKKLAARREDRANGNRRGFGLYMDEAWESAAARRRKTIDEYGYRPGLRAWLASKWIAGWAKAIDRHGPTADQVEPTKSKPDSEEQVTDQDTLGAPVVIDAELETKSGDTVADAFDSIPRSREPEPEVPPATVDDGPEPVTGFEIEVPTMPEWEGGTAAENHAAEDTEMNWTPFGAVSEPARTNPLSAFSGARNPHLLERESEHEYLREHYGATDADILWLLTDHVLPSQSIKPDLGEWVTPGQRQEKLLDHARDMARNAYDDSYGYSHAYKSAPPRAYAQLLEDVGGEPKDRLWADLIRKQASGDDAEDERKIRTQWLLNRGVAIPERPDGAPEDWKWPGFAWDELLDHEQAQQEQPAATSDQNPSDNEPINNNIQEESMSNTSGEVPTLPAALRFSAEMMEQITNAMVAVDQSRASLLDAGVDNEPISALHRALEGLSAARTAFNEFAAEIGRHQSVADALRAAPSAGNKEYLLGG